MNDNIKQGKEPKKVQNLNKLNKKIVGLDLDKIEYQEIVLSNSNFPDRDFYNQNYYN